VAQAGEGAVETLQDQLGADAVVEVGGMHDDPEDQALRVHHDVALAPADLLAAVEAARAALLARLGRLAVDDAGAGLRLAPDLRPQRLAQRRVEALPRPVEPPLPEIVVVKFPRFGRQFIVRRRPVFG
jgi:hypothetical protein